MQLSERQQVPSMAYQSSHALMVGKKARISHTPPLNIQYQRALHRKVVGQNELAQSLVSSIASVAVSVRGPPVTQPLCWNNHLVDPLAWMATSTTSGTPALHVLVAPPALLVPVDLQTKHSQPLALLVPGLIRLRH